MSNKTITRKIVNEKGEEIEVNYSAVDASKIEEFMFIDDPETGETTFRNGMVIKGIDDKTPQKEVEENAKLELVIEGKEKDLQGKTEKGDKEEDER